MTLESHKAAMSAPIKRDQPKPIPTSPSLWQRIRAWLFPVSP
jgi:hypothetical protein